MSPRTRWIVTTFGLAMTCAAAWMAGGDRDATHDKATASASVSRAADPRIAHKIATQVREAPKPHAQDNDDARSTRD